MQFYGNWCRFYKTAMFSLDFYLDENDVFLGNFALGAPPTTSGGHMVFPSAEAVLDTVGAPFIWKGGQTNANMQDFLLAASTDSPVADNISQITVEDDGSEDSDHFVVINNAGGTDTPQVPVTLKDNTVKTDFLNTDSSPVGTYCVIDNTPGVLNVEGGSYGLNKTPCSFYFNPASASPIWGRIVGVAMSAKNSSSSAILSLGTNVTDNFVTVSNNSCIGGGGSGSGTAIPCTGEPVVSYLQTGPSSGSSGVVTTNKVSTSGYFLTQEGTFSHVAFDVSTADGTNAYSVGIYDSVGNLLAHTAPASYGTTGSQVVVFLERSVPLPPGKYYLALTGDASTLVLKTANNSGTFQSYAATTTSSATGHMPATITLLADSPTIAGSVLAFYLTP